MRARNLFLASGRYRSRFCTEPVNPTLVIPPPEAELDSRAPFVIWGITCAIALAIVALTIVAPFSQAHGHPEIASPIYQAFSFVCHQIPERSFHLSGEKFGVCSRCTGLYGGFAVAALVYPLVRSLQTSNTPSRLWLMLAALPLGVDFALGYFSVWDNNHLTRVSTGALLSSVAVFFIMPGIIELGSMVVRWTRRESVTEVPK
jgi:uncharacterized membrane protein